MFLKKVLADKPKRPLRFEAAAAVFLLYVAIWDVAHPVALKKKFIKPPPNVLEQALTRRIGGVFDPPVSAWVAGLLLGDDSGFSPKWKEVFRRTGTTHVTAVSGYNVSLVFKAVSSVLLLMRLGRRQRAFLGLSAVAGFVILTGCAASSLRAALMATAGMMATEFLGRPVKPLRALLLAVVVLTVFSPRMLTDDRGFQLSALATFGLIALGPPIQAVLFRRWPKTLAGWLSETIAAVVATAPLIAWMSGGYSLTALVANVAVALFIPTLMGAGAAVAAFGFLWLAAARILAELGSALFQLPLLLLRGLSSLPFSLLTGWPAFLTLAAVEAASAALIIHWWRKQGIINLLYVEEEPGS